MPPDAASPTPSDADAASDAASPSDADALPAPAPGHDAAPERFVRLQHVTKRYQRGTTLVHALRAVDLTLPQGSFTAIVGRSGSGKSTLLHLLAAMDRPTDGRLRVGAWELGGLDRAAQARYRREMVGMIFQQFHLVPTMTAQENVALPLVLAGAAPQGRLARAAACLDLVGLADRRTHRPNELSGGEQQRVAVARALVADPAVLLADEPTGNLDSTTGAQIVDLLARVHAEQGRTVVVVTHHPGEIAHVAERVVTLHDGRVESDDMLADA
jgi:ABC-type lipoprotein export system ATPase subunit